MRRGTSVTGSEKKRMPVEADIDDLEGGGTLQDPLLMSPNSGGGGAASPYLSRQASNNSSAPQMDVYEPYSPSKKSPRIKRSKHHNTSTSHYVQLASGAASEGTLRYAALALLVTAVLLCPFLPITWSILWLVTTSCAFGALASLWLSKAVLQCDDGTPEMRAVSDPIRQGAAGFLQVQYSSISKIALPLALLIVVSYQFRPTSSTPHGVAVLGNTLLGVLAATGFCLGAICSAVSGYVSMWVAAQSNIRVASAARRSYPEALVLCFRGGAFSAVLNLTLCIAGVTTLYAILHICFVGRRLAATDVPMLLVGYGFGASFVALFMQLGGGIYTKAADGKWCCAT